MPQFAALSTLMPDQDDPWVLFAESADPLAYFYINVDETGVFVHANISGRHYDRDEAVLDILRKLQARVGGVVRDDYENEL